MEQTILVTGAKGMIGSHLVKGLLDAGYKVVGIDRGEDKTSYPGYTHYCCDLGNREKLNTIISENNISRIVHLAALAHSQDGREYSRDDYRYLNIDCAKNVFEAAEDRPVLFISTVDVYGFTHGVVGTDTEAAPVSDYAWSKKMAEEECRKLPLFTIFRFSPVYTDEIKRDIQKRYYLKYPKIAYQIGRGTEYEVLNVTKAVQSMVDWCSEEPENDIRIIKDDKPLWTPDCIKAEKAAGRAKVVLRFPKWLVSFGYMLLKLFTGKNKYTYLINKAVNPLRSVNAKSFAGTRVLVLDGYGRQCAIVLKELHSLGCEITTLNTSKWDVGYASKYAKHRIVEPATRYDMDELKKVLDREIPSGKYDVVFPMLEPATELLWQNKDVYLKYVKYAAADEEGFHKAFDKQLTMELCMKNGINCPLTKTDDESMDEFLSTVSFPLILKPRTGSGSRGIHKADSKEELDALIDSGEVRVNEYVIQEFIKSGEAHRVSYTFIDDNNVTKTSMLAKSTRPYPLGIGTNSLFESCRMPEIALQAEKLLKLMNWHGYASVCFIESDEDHVPKVMEINGRISASLKTSYCCGAHIVRQILEKAFGQEVTSYMGDYPENVRVRHAQASTMWFLKSPDRFRDGILKFRKTRDFVFSWGDPWPWFAYSIGCTRKYKTEMERRKR